MDFSRRALKIHQRFALAAVFALVLVMTTAWVTHLYQHQLSVDESANSQHASLRALWISAIDFQVTRMRAQVFALSHDNALKIALATGNVDELALLAEPTYKHVSALGIASAVALVNRDGKPLYHGVEDGAVGGIPQTSVELALRDRRFVSGTDIDGEGMPRIVIVVPLYNGPEILVGAAVLVQDPRQILMSLSLSTGDIFALVDDAGRIQASSAPGAAPHDADPEDGANAGEFMTALLNARNAGRHGLLDRNDRTWRWVTHSLEGSQPSAHMHLIQVTDVTEESRARQQVEFLSNATLLLVVFASFAWTYRFVVREADRLRADQAQRIVELDHATHSTEQANTELQHLHIELARMLTEREVALKQEAHLRRVNQSILDAVAQGVIGLDAQGLVTFVNPHARQLLGCGERDLLGRATDAFMVPSPAETDPIDLRSAPGNLIFRRGNGELFPVVCSAKDVVAGTPGSGVVLTFNDVTDRRVAEHALHRKGEELTRAHNLLDAVMRSLSAHIAVLDADGRILLVNDAWTRFAPYDAPGAKPLELGQNFLSMCEYAAVQGDRGAVAVAEAIRAVLGGNESIVSFERSLSSSTSPRWFLVTISPLRGTEAELAHVVMAYTDITARKTAEHALRSEKDAQEILLRRLEEARNQLLQSEKMASIGQLAAGVAHEINNPVGYVKSNLSTLRGYLEQVMALLNAYSLAEEPDAAEAVRSSLAQLKATADMAFLRDDIWSLMHECDEGLQRVAQIVRDLKDFSHVDGGERVEADLHRGLDSTLNIVWNELKYKATVVREYASLPLVDCVIAQINQVFMNLLVNAAHAMEQQGTIWVRTGLGELGWVWVEVEDTGQGIPPENIKRIFDPFFTTKPVGKGTGLGLALTYGIVTRHGGRIDVESTVGKGTRFRIWLPIRSTSAPEDDATMPPAVHVENAR